MALHNQSGLASSANYLNYAGLLRQNFSEDFLKQFYYESIVPKITTGEYTRGKVQTGDSVTFTQPGRVAIQHGFQDLAALKDQPPTATTLTIPIDRALALSLVMGAIAAKQLGPTAQKLLNSYKAQFAEAVDEHLSKEILIRYMISAHVANQGNNAGIASGTYNVGSLTAPYVFVNSVSDPHRVATFFANIAGVLTEQKHFKAGMCSVILPIAAQPYLGTSNLSMEMHAIGKPNTNSPLLKQASHFPYPIAGLNVYFSAFLTPTTVAGVKVFPVVFGSKKAMAFITQMESGFQVGDLIHGNQATFGKRMAALQVTGSGALYKAGIGKALIQLA